MLAKQTTTHLNTSNYVCFIHYGELIMANPYQLRQRKKLNNNVRKDIIYRIVWGGYGTGNFDRLNGALTSRGHFDFRFFKKSLKSFKF